MRAKLLQNLPRDETCIDLGITMNSKKGKKKLKMMNGDKNERGRKVKTESEALVTDGTDWRSARAVGGSMVIVEFFFCALLASES